MLCSHTLYLLHLHIFYRVFRKVQRNSWQEDLKTYLGDGCLCKKSYKKGKGKTVIVSQCSDITCEFHLSVHGYYGPPPGPILEETENVETAPDNAATTTGHEEGIHVYICTYST